jgi:hypothetical protein
MHGLTATGFMAWLCGTPQAILLALAGQSGRSAMKREVRGFFSDTMGR